MKRALLHLYARYVCIECRKGHSAHYRRDTHEHVHTVRNRGSGMTYHTLCRASAFRNSKLGKWLNG